MDIIIRLASPADAGDMARVLMAAWSAAYQDIIPAAFIQRRNAQRAEQFQQIITDENDSYYVVQASGKTAGYLRIVDAPADEVLGAADVEQIYFHPDYWRQGLGTRAMAFAQEFARASGKTTMTIWVLAQNTSAIGFYETCGFAADGTRKTYDYGKPLDLIRMRKALSP